MGPEALRIAHLREMLETQHLDVEDRGDLRGPSNPWQSATAGYRHLAEVTQWNQAIHDAVLSELRGSRMPILLGGDHCLGIGSISAVARHCRETGKKLRVLWLDAHADFNTSALTPSGNIHGMPVACLCGYGPQELIEIGGHVPAISPKWIRQIGIRSVDAGEKRLVHEAGPRGLRHALHRRDGHAPRDGAGAGRRSTPTRTCTSASTSTSSTRRSRPASAPPCRAARPTAKRSCAWR